MEFDVIKPYITITRGLRKYDFPMISDIHIHLFWLAQHNYIFIFQRKLFFFASDFVK